MLPLNVPERPVPHRALMSALRMMQASEETSVSVARAGLQRRHGRSGM